MASEQEDTLVEHQMPWGSGQEVLQFAEKQQWRDSTKMSCKFLLQTSQWLGKCLCQTVFLYNFAACFGRVFVWYLFWGLRTSWGRLCAFCFACVFSTPALLSVHRLSGSCRGPWGTSAHIGLCACDESMSHCGPPTRPCDSWGPLRQLRPTAHSDSVIMGGLLLWFTLTHARTHTRTQTLISCGPFLRCCPTGPQQGSPALQRRER